MGHGEPEMRHAEGRSVLGEALRRASEIKQPVGKTADIQNLLSLPIDHALESSDGAVHPRGNRTKLARQHPDAEGYQRAMTLAYCHKDHVC